jgi:MFS family permease
MPLICSGLGIALSAFLFVGLTRASPSWILIASFLAFGVGFGMLNAPITNVAVSGMPPSQAGVAAAVASAGRQIGQAIGVAVIGAIVIPGITADVVHSLAPASRPGWWTIAVAGITIAILTIAATSRRAAHTARVITSAEHQPVAQTAQPDESVARAICARRRAL